jgi:hypothetical protein
MEKFVVTNNSEETENDARSLLLDGRLQTTPLFKDLDKTCSLLVWSSELYCYTGCFTPRPTVVAMLTVPVSERHVNKSKVVPVRN